MIIDIVSIVLSFASIIQNFQNKKSLNEKIEEIKKALEAEDPMFVILIETKDIHHEYEQLQHILLPTFNDLKPREQGRNVIKEQTIRMHTHYSQLAAHKKLKYDVISAIDNSNVDGMPKQIAQNLQQIQEHYTEMMHHIKIVDESFKIVMMCSKKEDFGNEFEEAISKVMSSLKNVTIAADRVILNGTPIIDHFHCEVKKGLGGIS
jgi:hypothetical protein